MTSSQNQGSEGKKPTEEAAVPINPKRRRLLKGSVAAAPGIFTLYSGNAQALASAYQCVASTRNAFTGDEEFAGEKRYVDGYVRLAKVNNKKRRIHAIKGTEERWLVKVKGHYFEAGHASRTGASWSQVLNGDMAWKKRKINKGTPEEMRQFKDPGTKEWFTEDTFAAPSIQVLACIDDEGFIKGATPQDCDALGLTPTSGSCWASIS